MLNINTIKNNVVSHKTHSAWQRGVQAYASELLDQLQENGYEEIEVAQLQKKLLNGADSWKQYSDGGCALIYDFEIAERLCSPSELKKKRGGELNPNKHETWLDTQARALWQAEQLIMHCL